MREWAPVEMDCMRFCCRCNHSYDRDDIRNTSRDPLSQRRMTLRGILPNAEIRCIDTFYCGKDRILVIDVFWSGDSWWVGRIIKELKLQTRGRYMYGGRSEVYETRMKTYDAVAVHVYFE